MEKTVKGAATLIVGLLCVTALPAANAVPQLSGMWSDPPASALDAFCHTGCLIAAHDYLSDLLDDPVNSNRSYQELVQQAQRYTASEIMPRVLTPAALTRYPFDRTKDPSLTVCEPWGFTREVLSPHAMKLEQHEDHVTIYYSEWTALRTVYLDGRQPPADLQPSLLGYSVGHYDGDSLVVETSHISANHSNVAFEHTDQLTASERFTRVGDRLELELTLRDPPTLREPLPMRRAWVWAPEEEIYPYDACAPEDER